MENRTFSYKKKSERNWRSMWFREKSGHFFINKPLGLGFDDGLKSACLMLQYLTNGITKKLSDKKLEIKKTFQSPTMAPFCEDGEKYQVVDSIIKKITEIKEKGGTVGSQNIEKITTINGIPSACSTGYCLPL